MRVIKGSENVFADCGFPPAEAENLHIRAKMMMALTGYIQERKITQSCAARVMGVSQFVRGANPPTTYLSASSQMYSNISPPGIHDDADFSLMAHLMVQGLVYAPGSSSVASYDSVPKVGREMRSVR